MRRRTTRKRRFFGIRSSLAHARNSKTVRLSLEELEPRKLLAPLVAAYSFDEGAGTAVTDASGTGNHGVASSATWSTGKFGNALSFNGTSSIVNVPDSASLDLTTAMTLEAWVYPTTISAAWRDVVYKADDVYYLEATSGGNSRPSGGMKVGSTNYTVFGPVLTANTWAHLAVTYDGDRLRMFVNGVQASSQARTGPMQTSNNPLQIGGDSLYGQRFSGLIDEVRVYNTALTAAQIVTDMNTPIGSPSSDAQPPTVAIAAPLAGSTVSHVIAVTATATDNVGVASVQFFADGVSLGTDVSAPYSVGWNSTTVSNGLHSLTAVARDAAGNQTTSAAISVTTVNPGFVNEVVVPGITSATTMAFLPGGRMLVGELTDKIWVVQPGASQPDPTPFLQLDYSLLYGEQGLMDIAIDPNFSSNGYYYIFYTKGFTGSQNHNRLSRFTASGNGTVAGSEFVLWEDDQVAGPEHHAGSIAFGQDGKIYVTVGDNFQPTQSQQLTSFRGKVLRINLDGTVPTDNPFYDGAGPNKDAIWALGLRNPYRMSIDPVSGKMHIGDVGGNDPNTAVEEVNLGVRGANYGWPLLEGPAPMAGMTPPIHSYPHAGRDGAITGGVVYRGSQFPAEYYGSYFFGDYAQRTIKRLTFDANGNVAAAINFLPANGAPDTTTIGDPVKFVQGPDGSLYYIDIGFDGQYVPNEAGIRRIRYIASNQPPVAAASAAPLSGLPPLTVSFSSAGSSDPEGSSLTYSWNFGDGTSSTAANPTHAYQSAGRYIAKLTVSDGVNSTLSSDIVVTVGSLPTPTILGPANGSFFRAGDVINFSGSASDPDEGDLPASAFSWSLFFLHDSHTHPAGGPYTNTKTGSLTIPTSGHDFQGTTRYEIVLTVTDSTGLTSSTSVTIFPQKVNLTFNTVPSGLTLSIDGISKQTPFVLDDLIGFQHTIVAPAQTSGSTTYAFANWSDGGAQSHSIIVPAANQSYTATFQVPQTGLVAAYGFDEGANTAVTDASGTGNHGVASNTTWATGKYGKALSFNGTSSIVNVPDSASLDLTTAMTLEAWVYPTTISAAWRDVVYKADDVYYLEATSGGNSRPSGGMKVGSTNYTVFGPVLTANTWAHLALTYDGTRLRFYVNGVQASSQARTGPMQTSNNPLQIGGDSLYGQRFSGLIDEVRVYNVALTAAQIVTDMNTAVGVAQQSARSAKTQAKVAPLAAAIDVSAAQPKVTLGDSRSADSQGSEVDLYKLLSHAAIDARGHSGDVEKFFAKYATIPTTAVSVPIKSQANPSPKSALASTAISAVAVARVTTSEDSRPRPEWFDRLWSELDLRDEILHAKSRGVGPRIANGRNVR